MKVLYIEDEQALASGRHTAVLASDDTTWQIERERRLDRGRERLAQEYFDAVVLDLALPECHDLDACNQISEAASSTPLIVLAGTDNEAHAIQAVQAGAHDCLYRSTLNGVDLIRRLRLARERCRRIAELGLPASPPSPPRTEATAAHDVSAEPTTAAHYPTTLPQRPFKSSQADHRGPGSALSHDIGTPDRPIRLLVVDNDLPFLRWIRQAFDDRQYVHFQVDLIDRPATATEFLAHNRVDAVLVHLDLCSREGQEMLDHLVNHSGAGPVLVTQDTDDDALAVEAVRGGAEDVHAKAKLGLPDLTRSIRMALERYGRRFERPRESHSSRSTGPTWRPGFAHTPGIERRQFARYVLTKSVVAIPVLAGFRPDASAQTEGFLMDISTGGLGLEIPRPEGRCPTRWVVGVEADDGDVHYTTIEVCRTTTEQTRLRIGARFTPPARDVLSEDNLLPKIDPKTFRFSTQMTDDLLAEWTKLGVVRPILFDRAFVCPRCRALPTSRSGCPTCGSGRLSQGHLIHHFACAHVGYVEEFQRDDEIVCPKCRTRRLVVGADFEHLKGPHRCVACRWSGTELQQVGQCLGCGFRFPFHTAREEELRGYFVHRLDPIALIESS